MAKEFKITEEEIAKALNYLKYHDPENATREQAEALLRDLQAGYHGMAQHNPELLLKLQKDLKKDKKDGKSSSIG